MYVLYNIYAKIVLIHKLQNDTPTQIKLKQVQSVDQIQNYITKDNSTNKQQSTKTN